MTKEQIEMIWKEFVRLLTLDTFGESDIIMKGKKTVNLLGSVDYHKKVFLIAIANCVKDGLFNP